jgi:Golgi nucleoside diphosphatase
MNTREWLLSRTPLPPRALATRLDSALAAATEAREPAPACLDTAAALLAQILESGASDRASALDLLTADALVTYAFEAAAEDLASLDQRAVHAMHRLALLDDTAGSSNA